MRLSLCCTTLCWMIALLALSLIGCRGATYSAPRPAEPQHLGTFKTSAPEVDSVVQIADFQIKDVDTDFDDEDVAEFRATNSAAIPNALHQLIGQRQVFREVRRAHVTHPSESDFTVMGSYDFFLRLGTQGREWIPFAGTFGAPINEATARENMDVRVVDRDGREIFRRSYPAESQETASIYSRVNANYLQPEYLARIADDIVRAIAAGNASGNNTTESRLAELDRLRDAGKVSNSEYKEARRRILEGELVR